MSAAEHDLVRELNFARTRPREYAGLLEDHYRTLDASNRYYRDGVLYQMNEGRPAVQEAVGFLRSVQPLPALAASRCLSRAAADHVRDKGPRGATGHDGSDGTGPCDRSGRYLTRKIGCGENISYGMHAARHVMFQLIIDENQPGRGHRRIIFDPRYRSVGVAIGDHAKYQVMAVQLFASVEIAERFAE